MNAVEKMLDDRQPVAMAMLETIFIFLVFFIFAGWPTPDVNEAHYLAKAKHYWDPSWCQGDLFLESREAHLFFYWTLGWLNLFLSLPAVAWTGRLVTWGLLAWSWQRLSYAVVPRPLMSVLTAGLYLLLNHRFHMAGEWVVGGVEAKGLAYVMVFLAIEAVVRQRWKRVWILLGVATSLHVLVGGWSWIATGCAWLACGQYRPPLRKLWPWIVAGLLLAAPGVIVGLSLARGARPDYIDLANEIYVYKRLSHHLVFWRFSHVFIARHALMLVVWLIVCFLTPCRMKADDLGQRPLRGFVMGAVALAIIGIVIDQSLLRNLDLAASLLKYYWYRLSDAILPLGLALALAGMVDRWWHERPRVAHGLLVALTCIAAGHLVMTNLQRRETFRAGADVQMLPSWPNDPERNRRKAADWRQVCRWISDNTPQDATFITPRHQQTFKWYANRAEVFNWKDVPQDPESVVQWWIRLWAVYPRRVLYGGLAVQGEQRLMELGAQYNADYLILDRDYSRRGLLLPRVYPPPERFDSTYEVYRLPDPKTLDQKAADSQRAASQEANDATIGNDDGDEEARESESP